jgi:hypothetical protein
VEQLEESHWREKGVGSTAKNEGIMSVSHFTLVAKEERWGSPANSDCFSPIP